MFIQVGSRLIIITLVIAGGVLFENLILLSSFAFLDTKQQFAGNVMETVAGQALWALLTGSLFLLVFKNMHQRIGLGSKRNTDRNRDRE
jgi:hypothetical protein